MSEVADPIVQMNVAPSVETVLAALADVADPEMPAVSLVDLGMVHRVETNEQRVLVELLPTFVGCPALDLIRTRTAHRLAQVPGVDTVEVRFVMEVPWTSDRITPTGRDKLVEFGIAAPLPSHSRRRTPDCPYCGADSADVVSLFGPTSCRAVFYCRTCRQPFEGIKTV